MTDATGGDALPLTAGKAEAPECQLELKLSLDAPGIRRLRRAPFWRDLGRARLRRVDLRYFDTATQSLRADGLALRMRRSGRSHEQTLESLDREAGPAGRPHSDFASVVRVLQAEPDVGAVVPSALRTRLEELAREGLVPLFDIRLRRTAKSFAEAGRGVVEIVICEGEIVAGERTLPVCEVVLTLSEGEPALLFDVARLINDVAPARVQPFDVTEHGFALAGAGRVTWTKPARLRLKAGMAAEEALSAILSNGVRHLLENEACARTRSHIEGVHQVRVALRRMRSALRLYRPLLPPAQYEWLSGEMRWLAAAMGPARDLDVLRDELVAPVAAALGDSDAGFVLLEGRLTAAQDAAYGVVRDALESPRFTQFLIELLRWQTTRGWRDQPLSEQAARLFLPLPHLAARQLAKRHRAVRRRGRGFEGLSTEARHEVRIALKRLRYATDFFAALYPGGATKRYLKSLTRLQDDLGHLNDVATAERLLSALVGEGAPAATLRCAGTVLGWHLRGVAGSRSRLHEDWDAFVASRTFWKSDPAAKMPAG